MKKVVWGVLSTAKIGMQRVLPGMQKSAWCDIRAIASRTAAGARKAADQLGIAKAYGTYEELLADPEIEAIYNPLPNHLHVPLTLQAAAAGKHVLCEKPIALNADEARQLQAAAGKVLIMEAFMVRFHPQWLRARELVRRGDIGTLRAVQFLFCYANSDPSNIRNKADIGGGALYDIGCYAIATARYLFEAEPQRVVALIDRDPGFRTDRSVSALLDFGAGRRLDFTVSTQTVPYQRVNICGERKRIEVRIPFNSPLGGSTELWFDDGAALDGSKVTRETIPPCNMYGLQGDVFSRVVRGEIPLPYGVEDAILNMRVIDALFASERSAGWVQV